MKYLGIDTSGDYLTVVAEIDGKKADFYTPLQGIRHSETLMVEVEKIMQQLGTTPSDFDVFACVTGPGSFTGIRIGVATIKGFADALGKKVLGVTIFDVLSYDEARKSIAIVNANHGNFYVAGYDGGKQDFVPRFVEKDEFARLKEGRVLLSALPVDGLELKLVDVREGLKKTIELNYENASTDTDTVHPYYLRLSQAEEGRK